MKPDLTLLYSYLGLKPNCSLAELQLAYRRRISELQPDHQDPRQPSPEDSAMLRNLIWMYTTAGRFHRRHGRLPGAAPKSTAAVEPSNSQGQRTYASCNNNTQAPSHDTDVPPAQIVRGFFFLLAILLFGLLAWADWWDWLYW